MRVKNSICKRYYSKAIERPMQPVKTTTFAVKAEKVTNIPIPPIMNILL
jgi:hypothetical protein